jgi:hypothetical protein
MSIEIIIAPSPELQPAAFFTPTPSRQQRDRHHRLPDESGTLEHAQTAANHSSPRTAKLYDAGTISRSMKSSGS